MQFAGWLSHLDLGELVPVELHVEFGAGGTVRRCEWKVLKNGSFDLHTWPAVFDCQTLAIASDATLKGWRSTWTQDSAVSSANAVTVDFNFACSRPISIKSVAEHQTSISLHGTVRRRPSVVVAEAPAPLASWNFLLSPDEQPFEPHRPEVQCHRGVTWGQQGLVLDNFVDSYWLTEPLNLEITEKTLEVCFQLADLEQLSSGVISFGFMDDASAAFDSLTFNQRRPHEWINCSNFFSRTANVGGLAETSLEPLHMVVTYQADGFVTIYRNGVPYGAPCKIDRLLTLPAGRGRILLGARHVWPGPATASGLNGAVGLADGHRLAGSLNGRITYAALYDTALTAEQVALRAGTGAFKLWASVKQTLSGPEDTCHMVSIRQSFPPEKRRTIRNPASRAITIAQLQRVLLFVMQHCHKWTGVVYRDGKRSTEQLRLDVVNLYHVNTWLIRPGTRGVDDDSEAWDCSFVELLGNSPRQEHIWFVSHWWGEAIHDFIKCVQHHAFLRGLSENSYYWVCAYANRQHRLGDELRVDLEQTSFFKAMSSSVGVLVILDGEATPFRRIWCAFEEYVAMNDCSHLVVDIATCHAGAPKILAGTRTAYDEKDMLPTYHQAERERSFPVSVIAKSLSFDILAAQASEPSDREHILAWMRASEEGGIERVGHRLRSHFAIAAWRQCVELGQVKAYDLPEFVRVDGGRSDFVFDFSFLWDFTDADAEALASAMHTHIRKVDLNFEWCVNLSTIGLCHIAERVASCSDLETLVLNIRECTALDGPCVEAFLGRLPSSVREVQLYYHKKAMHEDCVHLGSAIARLLSVPLQKLHLSFRDCLELDSSALMSALLGLSASTILATCELSFERNNIDNEFLEKLLDIKLPLATLENLCLNLRNCHRIGAQDILAFGRRLLDEAHKLQGLVIQADVVEIRSRKELSDWCLLQERSRRSFVRKSSNSFSSYSP